MSLILVWWVAALSALLLVLSPWPANLGAGIVLIAAVFLLGLGEKWLP